eukprot:11127385-Alexandrium_andersonii.AAC.1
MFVFVVVVFFALCTSCAVYCSEYARYRQCSLYYSCCVGRRVRITALAGSCVVRASIVIIM